MDLTKFSMETNIIKNNFENREQIIIDKIISSFQSDPNIGLGFYLSSLVEQSENLSITKKKKSLKILDNSRKAILEILNSTQEQLNKL